MLFLLVAPIAMLIFITGFFFIKDKKEYKNLRLDYLSLVLSTIGFGSILYGFSSAGNSGWSHPSVYGMICIGVLSLISFILRQQKQQQPMLNFTVFRYPLYTIAISISMIVAMTLFSSMILVPIYFIDLRGIPSFDAGLMMVPGAIMLALTSPIVGRLFDKYGGRILALIGLSIITITSYYFSQLTFETSYLHLVVLNTIRMLGISMVMMPVATTGFNQLPKQYYSHGTAMSNTFQQVSGAIGTALLVTIMSNRTDFHLTNLNTSSSNEQNVQLIDQAMLSGINDAFFTTIFFSAAAFLLALFLQPTKQSKGKKRKEKISA
ncbi:MFS transporter [Alkalicoccobacillus plakortidis]|uniref:MFS transporter n=1 Tax=Alkalicoccobacillus plakortidis TaxID=444060 RepID=UPI0027D962DE|nr:MFS transporter [Alkalicoccobacillus plakortidis]